MFVKCLILCAVIAVGASKTVIVGQIYEQGGVRKVYDKTVEASAIPLFVRDEEIKFEYPTADMKIKGVAIKDLENGNAQPSITSGGLGFNFVTIKLKSERGSGYRFLIEVFA
ncbi:probable salivary secreted peptide [Leguminivora glycinivorella]|uniref:probable salivary secreted peptide n=1 Tax=Leguminivora glycinivorella TaxID=1035111 RepID=UPI002010C6AE|nr:probable salivary secreted peptide [Leguminivora glycinivorella]